MARPTMNSEPMTPHTFLWNTKMEASLVLTLEPILDRKYGNRNSWILDAITAQRLEVSVNIPGRLEKMRYINTSELRWEKNIQN